MNSSKKSHLIMILLITSGAGCPHAGFESVPLKLFAVKKFLCDVFCNGFAIFDGVGGYWYCIQCQIIEIKHNSVKLARIE